MLHRTIDRVNPSRRLAVRYVATAWSGAATTLVGLWYLGYSMWMLPRVPPPNLLLGAVVLILGGVLVTVYGTHRRLTLPNATHGYFVLTYDSLNEIKWKLPARKKSFTTPDGTKIILFFTQQLVSSEEQVFENAQLIVKDHTIASFDFPTPQQVLPQDVVTWEVKEEIGKGHRQPFTCRCLFHRKDATGAWSEPSQYVEQVSAVAPGTTNEVEQIVFPLPTTTEEICFSRDLLIERVGTVLGGAKFNWVLFEHGTIVVVSEPVREPEKIAIDLLKENGPVVASTFLGDFGIDTPKEGPGWLVSSHDPRIYVYVAPEEIAHGENIASRLSSEPQIAYNKSIEMNDLSIGLYGRSKRQLDSQCLHVIHVENSFPNA